MRGGEAVQKAKGNVGLIQINELKDSFVFQVVNDIRAPQDLDKAILATQEHIDKLQRHKGMRDCRILVMIPAIALISYAILSWTMISIPCAIAGFGLLYAGQKVDRYIARINVEINAANIVLTELYKHKISRQVGAADATSAALV